MDFLWLQKSLVRALVEPCQSFPSTVGPSLCLGVVPESPLPCRVLLQYAWLFLCPPFLSELSLLPFVLYASEVFLSFSHYLPRLEFQQGVVSAQEQGSQLIAELRSQVTQVQLAGQ